MKTTNNPKKVNLQLFKTNELLARLLVLQLNFNQRKDELIQDKEVYLNYCKQLVNDNFITFDNDFNACVHNLALFLLGNEKNAFSKILNNN